MSRFVLLYCLYSVSFCNLHYVSVMIRLLIFDYTYMDCIIVTFSILL